MSIGNIIEISYTISKTITFNNYYVFTIYELKVIYIPKKYFYKKGETMKRLKKDDIYSLEIFKNLKEETIDKLINLGGKKKLKKGELLFRDKDEVKYIYIVLKGKTSLYKLNEDGQKKIIFILGEGKVINGVIVDDFKASINCEAFETCEILAFNKNEFVDLMENDFELTKIIINSLALKVRRLYRQLKNVVPIKVEKRVAAKLWKLSKDYGIELEVGTMIDLNISITYFADMFGASRETISRALNVLQKEGLIIIENKRFIIKDREKLSRYFKGI